MWQQLKSGTVIFINIKDDDTYKYDGNDDECTKEW